MLPRLTPDDIAAVVARTRKLDADTGQYIRENLCYRWYETDDGAKARALERSLVTDGIQEKLPFISPGRIEAP